MKNQEVNYTELNNERQGKIDLFFLNKVARV